MRARVAVLTQGLEQRRLVVGAEAGPAVAQECLGHTRAHAPGQDPALHPVAWSAQREVSGQGTGGGPSSLQGEQDPGLARRERDVPVAGRSAGGAAARDHLDLSVGPT
jgi:hypothetical protein